jgi:hypothetical protein
MIYLHSTGERRRKIADALGEPAQAELSTTTRPGKDPNASGTYVARQGQADISVIKTCIAFRGSYLGFSIGAPGRIRTCDRLLRRRSLPPFWPVPWLVSGRKHMALIDRELP